MKLEIDFCRAYCSTSIFRINDIEADIEDFGERIDIGVDSFYYDDDSDYGHYGHYVCCKNMSFELKDPIPKVLEKYKITKENFEEIAFILRENLSFGECSLCN
jgi:hypothetical protein